MTIQKPALNRLTEHMEYKILAENAQGGMLQEITALVYDSRKIVPGCLFVCIRG